jgi:hypothetical protein
MATCQTCDNVLRWFLKPTERREKLEINLGAASEALAAPCPAHTALIRDLRKRSDGHPWRGGDLLAPDVSDKAIVELCGSDRQSGDVDYGLCGCDCLSLKETVAEDYFASGVRSRLLLANKPDVVGHPGTTRLLDPHWINLGTVKGWIDTCLERHGQTCTNPVKVTPTVPSLLVDVKRKCIVPGRDGCSYMALSYRLGNAALFRLNTTMVEALQNTFALDDPCVLAKLPLTVRHAIALTEALGAQYLWTDVLCIVHDSPVSVADQLNKMSAIYASALLTIVAADGDGAFGIPGLLNISNPREPPQEVFAVQDEKFIVHKSVEIDGRYATDVEYHKRGWTYQEYLVSPRKLMFVHREIYWICKQCEWHESDVQIVNHAKDRSWRQLDLVPIGAPKIDSLSRMLTQYNKRILSFDEDALPAISGLLTVLSREFTGGFLYGLPERFFDVALNWQPETESFLRRRTASQASSETSLNASGLPSWSWIAWSGGIKFGLFEVAHVPFWNGGILRETEPITEWYTSNTLHGQGRRKIASSWHLDRDQDRGDTQPLPEGWSRVRQEDVYSPKELAEERPVPEGYRGSVIYQHPGLEGHCRGWYYTFHMPTVNASTPFETPEQTRYLFCKTWKLTLWAHQDLHLPWNARNLSLRASDGAGPSIGRLYLHNEEQFKTLARPSACGAEIGAWPVDVVAISRSRSLIRQNSPRGSDLSDSSNEWRQDDEVNVLWVEWEQGIAYRLSSGYVEEAHWYALNPEEVDLVLG